MEEGTATLPVAAPATGNGSVDTLAPQAAPTSPAAPAAEPTQPTQQTDVSAEPLEKAAGPVLTDEQVKAHIGKWTHEQFKDTAAYNNAVKRGLDEHIRKHTADRQAEEQAAFFETKLAQTPADVQIAHEKRGTWFDWQGNEVPPGTQGAGTLLAWKGYLQQARARPAATGSREDFAAQTTSNIVAAITGDDEFKDMDLKPIFESVGEIPELILALAKAATKRERAAIKEEIEAGKNRWLIENNYAKADELGKIPGGGQPSLNGAELDRVLSGAGSIDQKRAAFRAKHGIDAPS